MDPRRGSKRRMGRWRFLLPIVIVPFISSIIILGGLLLLFPTMIPFAASLHLRDFLSIWVGYALIAFGAFLPFMSLGCCVACTSPTVNARARESMMADALLEEMVGGLGGALAEHYDVFQRGTSFYGTGWGRHVEVQEGFPAPIMEEGEAPDEDDEDSEGREAGGDRQALEGGARSAQVPLSTVDALTAAFGLAAARVSASAPSTLPVQPTRVPGSSARPVQVSERGAAGDTTSTLPRGRDTGSHAHATSAVRPSMTLVLLCGEGSPRAVNRGLAQHIAARTGFRALTVDLPGHGSLASVAFSLSRCERVLRAVIERELSAPSVPSSLSRPAANSAFGQRIHGMQGPGDRLSTGVQGSSGRSLTGSHERTVPVVVGSPAKPDRHRIPSKRAPLAAREGGPAVHALTGPADPVLDTTMQGHPWPGRAATRQVVLVAYGASAYVAAHFSACSPGLLAGLVLLGTVPRYDQFSPRNAAMKALYRLPWIHGLANLGLLGKVQAKAAASAAATATAAALSSSGVGGGGGGGPAGFHGSSTGRRSRVDESMEEDKTNSSPHFDSGAAVLWGKNQGLFTSNRGGTAAGYRPVALSDHSDTEGMAHDIEDLLHASSAPAPAPSSKVRPFLALRQQAGRASTADAETSEDVAQGLSTPLLEATADAELSGILAPSSAPAQTAAPPAEASPPLPLDPSRLIVRGYFTHLRNAHTLPTDHTPLAQVLVDEGCEWSFRVKPSYIREVQYARGYSAAENALLSLPLSLAALDTGDDEEDTTPRHEGTSLKEKGSYVPPSLTLVDPSLRGGASVRPVPMSTESRSRASQPPPLLSSTSLKRGFATGARGGGLWSALSALPRPILVLGPEAWVRSARKLLPVPQVQCMPVKGVRDETLPTLSARKTDALAAMLTEFAAQAFAISEQRLERQERLLERKQQSAAARAAAESAQAGSASNGLPSRAVRMSISGPASATGRRHSSMVSGLTGRSGSVVSHGTWSSPGTGSRGVSPSGPGLTIGLPPPVTSSHQQSPSVLDALARRGVSRSSSMGSASAALAGGPGMQRRPSRGASSLAEMQARFSVSSPEPVPEGAEKELEQENDMA